MGLLRPSTTATVLVGAASGAFASWVKVLAEAPMQRIAEQIWPPAPGQKELVGADPAGRPERMPPAVIATAVWKRMTGRDLAIPQALAAQTVIQYAFGTGFGVVYALLARSVPAATLGLGAAAGVVLYGLTHGAAVPALGVQPSPAKLPRAAVAWEGGSQVVFGVALDVSRSLLSIPVR